MKIENPKIATTQMATPKSSATMTCAQGASIRILLTQQVCRNLRFIFSLLILNALSINAIQAQTTNNESSNSQQTAEVSLSPSSLTQASKELPTYIKSENLTLRAEDRVFVYSGNVEVRQGDLTLTSDQLEGTYTAENVIKQLVATQNVVIVKGDSIRAKSERAVYDAATETLSLTENPELQQDGSVLTADLIKIFMVDDRSLAEGNVRVKIEKATQKGTKESAALP